MKIERDRRYTSIFICIYIFPLREEKKITSAILIENALNTVTKERKRRKIDQRLDERVAFEKRTDLDKNRYIKKKGRPRFPKREHRTKKTAKGHDRYFLSRMKNVFYALYLWNTVVQLRRTFNIAGAPIANRVSATRLFLAEENIILPQIRRHR